MAAHDQQDVPDDLDLPIALRKKRRTSTAGTLIPDDNLDATLQHPAITPKKGKKRVRFSYPPTDVDNDGHPSATGLTPSFKRSRLQTPGRQRSPPPPGKSPHLSKVASKATSKAPRRRASMPAVNANPSAAASGPIGLPITDQTSSIEQVLDSRTRRILARNGLSEVQNTANAERRLFVKQNKRIQELEAQLATAQEEARRAVEARRPSESFMRCQQLEAELQNAHEELETEASIPESANPGTDFDDFVDVEFPSPCPTEPFSDHGDHHDVPPLDLHSDEHASQAHVGVQTDANHHEVASLDARGDEQPPQAHAGVQIDLQLSAMANFQTQISEQVNFLVGARRELENILPGETALPLKPTPDGDASPLISALIKHLRNAKAELTRTEHNLKAITDQEKNMRSQFNEAVGMFQAANLKVKECFNAIKTTNAANAAHRQRIRDLEKDKKILTTDITQATARVTGLETEVTQHEVSIARLTGALQKCYSEIEDYQRIIMTLEESQAAELEKLKAEHAAAVSSLESDIQDGMAERVGLEKSFGARDEELKSQNLTLEAQRKEAEFRCKEWREAVYTKQNYIRDTEARLHAKQKSHEKDIGRLNVRLSETQGRLYEIEGELRIQQKHSINAVKQIMLSTRTAGDEAVREIIRTSNGQAVGLGLLTPDLESDFKPEGSAHVEGEVETRRGTAAKKRKEPRQRDSGIEILTEEDETDENPMPLSEP